MEPLVPGAAVPGGYEVRVRWDAQRVAQSLLPLIVVAWILYPYNTRVKPVSMVFGGLMLALFAAGALTQFSMGRAGCLIRLDPSGVTVHGGRTVPWNELDRVTVVRKRALAFHARWPDAELPLAPIGRIRRRPERARARMTRRYGTPLVVLPNLYGVRREDIVAAVRRYSGGLPVFDGD